MSNDWLLVETLGSEPVVVADGTAPTELVPVGRYLRRSPHLASVQTAINETVASATGLASLTPNGKRVIRTEPVTMTDGTIHGVQVWIGKASAEPPPRPMAGPLVWNLTTRIATDTPQSLVNSGLDPETAFTSGRAFAEDIPARNLKPTETRVLSRTAQAPPGTTYCRVWDAVDQDDQPIAVGWVVRVNLEPTDRGGQDLVARAMNWRAQKPLPETDSDANEGEPEESSGLLKKTKKGRRAKDAEAATVIAVELEPEADVDVAETSEVG